MGWFAAVGAFARKTVVNYVIPGVSQVAQVVHNIVFNYLIPRAINLVKAVGQAAKSRFEAVYAAVRNIVVNYIIPGVSKLAEVVSWLSEKVNVVARMAQVVHNIASNVATVTEILGRVSPKLQKAVAPIASTVGALPFELDFKNC